MAKSNIPGMWTQWRVAISVTLAVLSCGMQFSWSSPAVEKIKKENLFELTSSEISWAVSVSNLGAILGSVISGFILDRFGRKWCIFITNGPFIIGWVLIFFAESAEWLYVARILSGIAVGMSLNAAPIYVGEIASMELRGSLGTLCMLMINMGVLFEYVCGPFLSYRMLALTSSVVPIVCIVSVMFVPESPVFLVSKDNVPKARRALQVLRGSSNKADIDEELRVIQNEISDRRKSEVTWKEAIRSPGAAKALIIVSFLGLMQQMCGNAALLAYFEGIYTSANSPLEPFIAYLIISLIQVGSVLVSSWTVDKSGRRPLFLLSCSVNIIAYVIMGTFFFLKDHEDIDMDNISWLPLAMLAIVIASFNLGLGPLVYVLMGEILPQEVRALGATSAAILISVGSFVVTKMYPLVAPYTAFWTFAGLTLLTAVFIWVVLPETKGRTREEIRQLMANNRAILSRPV